METGEQPIIKIDVFANGDFNVFDGKTGEQLNQISFGEVLDSLTKGIVDEPVVTPLITYLKTGSGVVIIGGRRYLIR